MKEKERDKSRQKTFDHLSLTCFLLIYFLLEACLAKTVMHLWQTAKDIFGFEALESKLRMNVMVYFVICNIRSQHCIFGRCVVSERKLHIGALVYNVQLAELVPHLGRPQMNVMERVALEVGLSQVVCPSQIVRLSQVVCLSYIMCVKLKK